MSFRTTGIPVSERPDLNRILAIGLNHAMTSVSIGVTPSLTADVDAGMAIDTPHVLRGAIEKLVLVRRARNTGKMLREMALFLTTLTKV